MAITRGVGPLYISLQGITSNNAVLTGTTAHRSLVFVAFWYDPAGTATPTIAINGESNATPIAGSKFTNSGANNGSGQIFYLADIQTGGNKTITITFAGTAYATVAVIEYVGLDLTSQPDNSTSATGLDPARTATTALTTNTANALIVAGGLGNSGELTAGSGYTLFGGGGMPNDVQYSEAEDQLDMGSPASKTVAFVGDAAAWGLTAASFKIAGGAGTTPKTFTGTDSLAGGELL